MEEGDVKDERYWKNIRKDTERTKSGRRRCKRREVLENIRKDTKRTKSGKRRCKRREVLEKHKERYEEDKKIFGDETNFFTLYHNYSKK